MKKHLRGVLAVLLLSMLAVLCAQGMAAADARQEYALEENTAGNSATYPYVIHTGSATWYLSADDIGLLGEEAYFQGLYEVLEFQDADFADARAALSGYIRDEIEPIDIYTDFCGKAGISGEKLVGAYYNPRANLIKVFKGWEVAEYALLHEYVHYLTLHCTDTPVTHGLFAEGIADYISMIACSNRMMRACTVKMDGEQKAFFMAHGVWDEEEDCLDPRLYEIGQAERYAQGQSMGEEYLSTVDIATVRTAEIQQNPTAETISHFEAASIIAYLMETYTKDVVFAHLDMNPAEMEQVFGEPFEAVYEHWKEWNTEIFNESGMVL